MRELTLTDRRELTFFPQGDEQLTPFLDATAFERDLIGRMMLEPGVVLTDVYFLISRAIQRDLSKGPESWIHQGIKHGIVVPAFRSSGTDFSTLLEEINQMNLVGVLSDAGTYAAMLHQLDSTGGPRITWPEMVGVSFDTLLTEYLIRHDEPPGDSDEWSEIWARTRYLRTELLPEAQGSEENRQEAGVRRSTILRVIAKHLDFKGDPARTNDLLEAAPRDATLDRRALSAFLLWVNELYHHNHASRFRVRPSFPVARAEGAGAVPKLLWETIDQSRWLDTSAQLNPLLFEWPSASVMVRAQPSTLLQIRADEPGLEYLAALGRFRAEPTEDTWNALGIYLTAYAQRVCSVFSGKGTRQIALLSMPLTRGLKLGSDAIGAATSAAVGYQGLQTHDPLWLGISILGLAATFTRSVPDVAEWILASKTKGAELAYSAKYGFKIDLPA